MIAAVNVYFTSFSFFPEYDDEGYVMIGLRSFLRGHPLYDYVHSQYGPFYYLVEGSLYRLLHLQVTHDAVRGIMAALWLSSVLLCSWAIYRLTKNWVLTALGFTAAVKLISFFVGSPGHPEELCLVLLIGILICVAYFGERPSMLLGALLGSLLAALALTKINIGIFAAGAISLALLKAMPNGKKQGAAFGFIALASLCLPIAIMRPLLDQRWVESTVALILLSMICTILVAWWTATERIVTPALVVAGISGFILCAAIIIVPILMRGTTLSAMFFVVLLQHLGYAKNWNIAFYVRSEIIPIASLGLAVGWLASANTKARGRAIVVSNLLKLIVSIFWCLELRTGNWQTVYSLAIPCTWLLLVPGRADSPNKLPFARLALALLAVWSALYMLPVAGAQVAFSVVLTIPMVCVFLDDVRAMFLRLPGFGIPVRVGELVAVLLLLATNFFWARTIHYGYGKMRSLALPGAEAIHVPRWEATTYQWITATLDESCKENFSMPGIFSLYFWTDTDSPTRLAISNWYGLLTHQQQQQIVNDLARFPSLCVVYNSRLVEGWRRGQDLTASPLARYIHDNFVPIDQREDYYILARKGQIQPKREFDSDVVALPR